MAKKEKKFPSESNRSYQDIFDLTVESLVNYLEANPHHGVNTDDYFLEIGLCEILRGHVEIPEKILTYIREENRSLIAAELTFHSLKKNLKMDKLWQAALDFLPKTSDRSRSRTHAMLAVVFYLQKNTAEMARYETLALESRLPELNTEENSWPLLNMYFMTNRSKIAIEKMADWQLSIDYRRQEHPMQNLIWYGTINEIFEIARVYKGLHADQHSNGESYFCELAAKKIVQDKEFDQIDNLFEIFPTFGSSVITKIFEAMLTANIDIKIPLEKYLYLKSTDSIRIDAYDRLQWLGLASHYYPDLAVDYIQNREWNLSQATRWASGDLEYKVFWFLAQIAYQIKMPDIFDDEIAEMSFLYQVPYFASKIYSLNTTDADNLLRRTFALIPEPPDSLAMTLLRNYLIPSAFHSKSTEYENFLQKAKDLAQALGDSGRKKKDFYQLIQLMNSLAEFDLNEAYQILISLPKAEKLASVYNFFTALCRAKEYNSIFELLSLLPNTDLNLRLLSALKVLRTLSNSRGDLF